MNKITRENAEKLIKSSNGSIFSVQFVKADGSLRDMVCRLGVSKGITGKGLSFDPSEHDLITVFDMSAKGYRMIRLDTLRHVTTDGQTWAVIQ
jgi:hypothetical protein